jgi:hypothetical protein
MDNRFHVIGRNNKPSHEQFGKVTDSKLKLQVTDERDLSFRKTSQWYANVPEFGSQGHEFRIL